jgi:L-rhamnose-H+ transport protein
VEFYEMVVNPLLGVVFHWLGGLASGSFYVPYRLVQHWAWETYWLVGGFFSWIIAPWVLAFIMVPHLATVLAEQSSSTLFWTYFWGAMWGLGGLTFGLTMRYLGMSLGMAVALGYCAAFGTLMPPLFKGDFQTKVLGTRSGIVILIGVAVCLFGIAIAGLAGMTKEREMPEAEKKKTIREFNFLKGILVATFSGIMSASMSYGLEAGESIATSAAAHGTSQIWTGLPKLVVVLLGGFTTNFLWCALLNIRNRTGYQYVSSIIRRPLPERDSETIIETAFDAPSEEVVEHAASLPSRLHGGVAVAPDDAVPLRAPMIRNYLLSALAGTTWYMQFFFYTMGETQMGQYKFSSWTLHMASIIIFSTLWGIALKEWNGASSKVKMLLFVGIITLIGSTAIVGYGNYLAAVPPDVVSTAVQ